MLLVGSLYDREPIPKWTEGRITLLGDAAHPMLPHLGQGANQSNEDGVTLAILLRIAGKSRAVNALQDYERLRREHTAQVQNGSRTNGLRYDSETGATAAERDNDIRATQEMRWAIYDYDAISTAEENTASLELTGGSTLR